MSMPAAPGTVTELLLAQAGSSRPGLCYEDRRWTWREHVRECARYAAALRARRQPGSPFHVGVLADNVPEVSFLLGGCAFAGAVLVALNPARRGNALASDVARTDCQYVLAEPQYAALLPAMNVPVLPLDGLELPEHAPLDVAPAAAGDLLMLVFTSGTGGEPKAVRCTHGKIAFPGKIASLLPRTPTFKVLTRVLAADRWHTSDPVWWRPYGRGHPAEYVVLDAAQAASLDARIGAGPGG